jgi:hypothetical protein
MEDKDIIRTIRIPKWLRDEGNIVAKEGRRSLQEHIVYLLEKDVKAAKRRRSQSNGNFISNQQEIA